MVLPFTTGQLLWTIQFNEITVAIEWLWYLEVFGIMSFSFWLIGRGLKKYHPPLEWSEQKSKILNISVNLFLLLPLLHTVYVLLSSEYYFNTGIFLSFPLTFIGLFFIFLMNRKLTNEDLVMAKKESEQEEIKFPEGYQRRMRFTVIFMALAMLVSMFFVVYANIQVDIAKDELDMERWSNQEDLEELNAQIDSLTSEIEKLKLQNDTISNRR